MSPWSDAQRVELAEAMALSHEAAERESLLLRTMTMAGRMMEALTDLESLVADVDDDRLSTHVSQLRLPLVGAGNRLAALRTEVPRPGSHL